jgi:hypothetical protein
MLHQQQQNQKKNTTLLTNVDLLDQFKIKQVEINTISAGFGHVSTRASILHREILKWSNYKNLLQRLPDNSPIEGMGKGFVETWNLYNQKDAIILFVVLDIEINIADQRHLEYEIQRQNEDIEIVRCTLEQMYEFGHLSEEKELFYQEKEVAIIYYRAGYDPEHYKTQKVNF